jgi:hypothetical protein
MKGGIQGRKGVCDFFHIKFKGLEISREKRIPISSISGKAELRVPDIPNSILLAFLARLQEEEGDHGKDEDDGCEQLGERHLRPWKKSPLVAPEAFHEKTGGAVKNQIPEKNLALKFPLCMEKKEDEKNHKTSQRGIKLGRMEGNVRGRKGVGVGENDSPGQIGGSAVTAPGHETTDAAHGLPQGKSRGPQVSGGPEGEMVTSEIPCHGSGHGDKASGKDQPSLPDLESVQGMSLVVGEIDENIEQS